MLTVSDILDILDLIKEDITGNLYDYQDGYISFSRYATNAISYGYQYDYRLERLKEIKAINSKRLE